MARRTQLTVAVLVIALGAVAAWIWQSRQGGAESNAIDLVELFPEAEKRTTVPSLEDAFAIQNVTINNDRKRSIFAHPYTRILWTVTVPPGAVLRTAAALRPDVWTIPGDGGLFRIGVSDGATYSEFFRQMVQPFEKPSDRRWFPVEIDLSAYTGKQVKIVFNTEPGDARNTAADHCVWGAPRIESLSPLSPEP